MSRIVIEDRSTPSCLLVALPENPLGATSEAHWWLVGGDGVETGIGSEWIGLAASHGSQPGLIGLAPSAAVRLAFANPPANAANARQARAIARVQALDQCLGEPETLHSASATLDGEPPAIVTAIVANAKMQEWLDWADAIGVRLDHVVPAAMILPMADQWVAAQVGSERIIGRRGMTMPDEPALKDGLTEAGEQTVELDLDSFDQALKRIAVSPVPDLRSGRFARRRRIVIDRSQTRELLLLALAIVLVASLVAMIEIIRLDRSRADLDAETLEIARAAAGPGVNLDGAEAALAARAGAAAGGSMSSAVAALLTRMQAEQTISMSSLGYTGGALNVTLASQGPDAINRVLLALQRDGYRVTAVPRTESDGRTFADLTLSEGP